MIMQKNEKPYLIMTPGPTQMHPDVLDALSLYETNPDLDSDFLEFYRILCQDLSKKMNASGPTIILTGEGILGLEAACASMIEPGDRVLTISNGIFGRGFDDFSKMYGAQTVLYEGDLRRGLDPVMLDRFIMDHGPFKVATVVHCETPSGITNDLETIGKVLNRHGILSIVDAVSSFGGEKLSVDDWGLDVVLSGSQKVLSGPAGLSTVTLSKRAVERIKGRTTPIPSYYANLSIWLDYCEKKSFPYTQPVQMLIALEKAVERLEVETLIKRHKIFAEAVRGTFKQLGFELYALDHESNTVTTVLLPPGVDFKTLFNQMKSHHGVLIGGGFNFLENKIFRIGHMGENLSAGKIAAALDALQACFDSMGAVFGTRRYSEVFLELLEQQHEDLKAC
jgi:aspartate aminotransferase-like enzyme